MSLIITKYNLLKQTVESEFNCTLDIFKNTGINFVLKYPSNPILDCQIIDLHEEPITNVIANLNRIINEDEYGINSRVQLIQFRSWILKVVNIGNEMYI